MMRAWAEKDQRAGPTPKEDRYALVHHRLHYALVAAAGLGLRLALIAFGDAWFSGSGFSGVQFISAY
jgi:hypothetical protein